MYVEYGFLYVILTRHKFKVFGVATLQWILQWLHNKHCLQLAEKYSINVKYNELVS
jgi:hypothetical protein